MKPIKARRDIISVLSLLLIAAIVILAQLSEGGRLRALLQPTAALVVIGGTAAALLLSFPVPLLWRTWIALGSVFRHAPETEKALVTRFERFAVTARRRGVAALENDFNAEHDPFLKRGLGLLVDGVTSAAMKEALVSFSRHEGPGAGRAGSSRARAPRPPDARGTWPGRTRPPVSHAGRPLGER